MFISKTFYIYALKEGQIMSTEADITNSHKSVRLPSMAKVSGKFPVKLLEDSTLQSQYGSNEPTKSFKNVLPRKERII
jgi:hypothetical protein